MPCLQLLSFQRFCEEHKLDSSRFGLEKDGKALDLSLPLRFSGLPNNCVVDLAERAVSAGALVRIALQTPGGQRLQAVVSPSTTLADVLRTFVADGSLAADGPTLESTAFTGCTVVYMRSSVSGAALRDTSLAAMGITGGSVSLRLQMPPAASASASAAAAEDPPAPRSDGASAAEAQASVATGPQVSDPPVAHSSAAPPTEMELLPPPPTDSTTPAAVVVTANSPVSVAAAVASVAEVVNAAPAAGGRPAPPKPSEVIASAVAAVAGLRAAAFDEDASVALLTVVRILDNLIARPADAAVRRIRLGNATFHVSGSARVLHLPGDPHALPSYQARVGRFPPAVDVLRAAGFDDLVEDGAGAGDEADATLVLSPETENRGRIRKVWLLAMLELYELPLRRARILPAGPRDLCC